MRGGGGRQLPNKGGYGCAGKCKTLAGQNQKTQCPGKKVPKNLMTGQVFMNFRVPKLKFSASRSLFSLLSNITHFLVKNCQKPNTQSKFTSQNLMPRQKLNPEIPTFIRESPPSPHFFPQSITLSLLFSFPKFHFTLTGDG